MTDAFIEFFRNYSEYLTELGGMFNLQNSVKLLFRSVGWFLIRQMHTMCSQIENIFYRMFDLMDILKADSILGFLGRSRQLALMLLTIPIIILGYRMITDSEFNGRKVVSNVIYSIVILLTVTGAVSLLSELTQAGISEVNSGGDQIGEYRLSTADELLSTSVIDLVYKYQTSSIADLKNGRLTGDIWDDPNNMSSERLKNIDINELVCYTLADEDTPFAYHYYLDTSGDLQASRFPDCNTGISWLDTLVSKLSNLQTSYARYHVDFFNLIMCLLALTIAYFCAVYKICRIIFELIVSELMLQFSAVLDLSGAERTKKIVTNILSSFLSLFGMAILFRLYRMIYSYVLHWSFLNEHHIIRTLVVVAFSLGILDGPDVINRILGVDVGNRSLAQSLQSMFYATSMVRSAYQAATGAVSSVSGAAGTTAGYMRGSHDASAYAENHGITQHTSSSPGTGREEPSSTGTDAEAFSVREFAASTEANSNMEESSYNARSTEESFTGSFDTVPADMSGTEQGTYADVYGTEQAPVPGTDFSAAMQEDMHGNADTGQTGPDMLSTEQTMGTVPDAGPSEDSVSRPDVSRDNGTRPEDTGGKEYIGRQAGQSVEDRKILASFTNSVNGAPDLKEMMEGTDPLTPIRSLNEGYRKGYSFGFRRRLRNILRRDRQV